MARPYTETFVRSYTAATYVRWFCPVGKRAVLVSVVATGNGAVAGQVSGWINGIPIARIGVQATFAAITISMRAVIYGGQELLTYISADGIAGTWSGYLFDDPTNATGPPGALQVLTPPQVEELPAELR